MDRIFTNNNPENPVDPVQISFFLAQTGCGSASGAALMKLHKNAGFSVQVPEKNPVDKFAEKG